LKRLAPLNQLNEAPAGRRSAGHEKGINMVNVDLNWIANFIWGIADDVLRDLYVRGKYRDVILPMMVLRRLDAVLEPTNQAVLDMKASLDAANIANQDAALRQAAGQAFYNTSKFTLRDLKGRARNHTGFAELPILEVSLRTGVRVREFENSTRKQVMSNRDKYKRAAKGDIAYNMMRMWQGAVGVAPVDGLISPAYVVASPLDGIDSRYFTSLFRTPAYMGEIDNHSHGIVKDRNRLYWEDFKQIFSPYPPPQEQGVIADFVQSYTASIGNLIDQAKREIDLLNEYRTRLIADVVTGKLDVRAAAAALPDEIDEPDLSGDINADTEDDEDAPDDDLAEADV
jgi:hypothetical protein